MRQTRIVAAHHAPRTTNATFGLAFALLAFVGDAFACSFAQPIPTEFDPAFAESGEVAPEAPKAKLESIWRGGEIGNGSDSCNDTGLVVLSIPTSRRTRNLVYRFEAALGIDRDMIFDPTPVVGFESEGKLLFVFPWVDGAEYEQEPLRLMLRVTAYTRSGLRGGYTDLPVTHPGRGGREPAASKP